MAPSTSINIIQISAHTVKPESQTREPHQLDLSPADLVSLPFRYIQRGLLFNKPQEESITILVDRLLKSFSRALEFFFPLAGRIATRKLEVDNTVCFYIDCTIAGADFIHAKAEITMEDVVGPLYIPEIVHALFPLNGVISYNGISKPLVGVQVTELVDGIFIGCSMNHAVVDGNTFWHFMHSWSEIAKAMPLDRIPSRLPVFTRWCLEEADFPIWLPSSVIDAVVNRKQISLPILRQRIFHFSSKKIAQLKMQANAEKETHHEISSLQALLSHVWRTVTRARCFDPNQVVLHCISVGNRNRLIPPLPEEYFGNSIGMVIATAKAGELVQKSLGWAASLLNRTIRTHNDTEIRSHWATWLKNATIYVPGTDAIPSSLMVGSSPRFDMYGNDFGWGRPVTVRCGYPNPLDGMTLVHRGAVEGSIDVELSLSPDTLKTIGDNIEFTETVA